MRGLTTTSKNPPLHATDAPSPESERRAGTAGVVMYANIDGESDSAAENRSLALRLAEHHFPVQIAPIGGQPSQSPGSSWRIPYRNLQALLHDRLDLAESVLYQSGAPTSWNLDFYGRCRVGRTAFGTDRIPDGWAERCNELDELWLPSEFHRETFAASGVERNRIRVLSQAIDSTVFRPGLPPLRIAPAKSFQFLAVADGVQTSGIDILVRAFIEEFSPHEDVALVLHCPPNGSDAGYFDFEAEIIHLIETELGQTLEDIPVITLVMGPLPEEARAGLFAASNAFVQPARAAATGNPCIEALSCQLPVIATDWGPLNDFLSDQNSFPLAMNGVVPAHPEENELFAGHRWAEPSLDHLRHQMREVLTHPGEAAGRAQRARRDVINRFEWSVVLPEWTRNFRRLLR